MTETRDAMRRDLWHGVTSAIGPIEHAMTAIVLCSFGGHFGGKAVGFFGWLKLHNYFVLVWCRLREQICTVFYSYISLGGDK